MKKTILFMVLIVAMLCISSCGLLTVIGKPHGTDRKISNERFENLLDKLESKDHDGLKLLFAESAKQTEDFDEKLSILINYYKGNSYNYEDDGRIGVSTTNKYGTKKITYTDSFVVYTTEETYRIYLIDIVRNDFDENECGITSLYIIKYDLFDYSEIAYSGDGKETPGIHIAKTREN